MVRYRSSAATSINYQPAADFFGTETFTYTVNDGTPGSNDTATVTITVTPANDAPTANDDSFTVAEDSGVTALNVLDNDTTEAGENLTITAVSAGSQGGSLSIVGGNSINYQPADDFFGTETFTYTVNDGTPGSNDTATVTVTVTPVNDAPTANDDSFTVAEDSGVTALNVLDNDSHRSGREPDHHRGQRRFAGWLAVDRRRQLDQLSTGHRLLWHRDLYLYRQRRHPGQQRHRHGDDHGHPGQ